jgi:hypothetical protein
VTAVAEEIAYPDQTYGELREGLHVAGYALERAFQRLESMLPGDAWMKCGPGFTNVNAFIDSLRLDQFKAVAVDRRKIAQRIKELQPDASNRQIARTLGCRTRPSTTTLATICHSTWETPTNSMMRKTLVATICHAACPGCRRRG